MRNLNSLTPQELQVVKLLAKGYSRDEVVQILHVSRKSLDVYIGIIKDKICDTQKAISKSNLIVNIIRNALLKNIISIDDLKEEIS